MKRLVGVLSCSAALLGLFTAEFCRADFGFLMPAGNNFAICMTDEPPTAPKVNDVWNLDSTNRDETSDISSSNASQSRKGSSDLNDKFGIKSAVYDSPFKYILLIAITAGAVGFAMIAAVAVQWRRQRSLKRIRLFPSAEISAQPFPVVAPWNEPPENMDLLTAKHNQESKNAAQRRAA